MNTLRLTRASQDVGSFLSVFGELRETRLTAVLGFLVAQFPGEFGDLLGFRHSSLDEVSVEETDEGTRYDLLIRRSGETHIIEGKIGPTQRVDQLLRYIRRVRKQTGRRPALTVVDDGSQFSQSRQRSFQRVQREVRSLRFVTWSEVAALCGDIVRKKRNATRTHLGTVIARELAQQLQENNMTTDPQPEIYLRDVSSTSSVELFFRHHIYKCQSRYYNSARRNLYFAPYFTRTMADTISEVNLVPVGEGISFVSRIHSVQVIDKRDILAFLKEHRHPHAKEAADLIIRSHRARDILLMLLGVPRLLFLSPVTKGKLSKSQRFGRGAMGSRSCSFDDLLAASQS